jgi:hypothetical protein
VHDPTMTIRVAINALKDHTGMLSEDKGLKMTAAVNQFVQSDSSVADLDNGSQADAELALKVVCVVL